MKNSCLKALSCVAALALPGCVVVTDDEGVGTLTLEWTIDGLRDPADCAGFAVDRLELVLFTGSGRFVDQVEPVCESFGVALELVEGRYYGDATMVDRFGAEATLTQPIDAIDIIEGTDLVVTIDFPLDSFF